MPNNAAFNPTILSGQLLRKLRMSLVFNSIVSRDYEGEITGPEDSVKILAPLAVSVEDADGSKMSYGDQLLAEDAVLSMEHKKRFGFLAKDIDNASAAADVFADETFQEVLKSAQQYVLAQYTEADNANEITVAAGDDMGTRLRDAAETLDEQEAPEQGRFIVLPPSAVREIEDELSDKGTQLGDMSRKLASAECMLASMSLRLRPATSPRRAVLLSTSTQCTATAVRLPTPTPL